MNMTTPTEPPGTPANEPEPLFPRRAIVISAAAGVALSIVAVVAVLASSDDEVRGRSAASGVATTTTTRTATTPDTTTTTTPPPPPPIEVSLSCSSIYDVMEEPQMFVVGWPPDFSEVWAAQLPFCEASRGGGALTPREAKAVTAAQYTNGDVSALYSLCAAVDPDDPYLIPSTEVSPEQVAEVNGMLTLCPKHPYAKELRRAMTEGQQLAQAEARGELFYAGTFRVGAEIKPGTYVIDEASEGCYWERLDASGEIIDNNFLAGATRVEVTIVASDYSFHNEGCGPWRKVS